MVLTWLHIECGIKGTRSVLRTARRLCSNSTQNVYQLENEYGTNTWNVILIAHEVWYWQAQSVIQTNYEGTPKMPLTAHCTTHWAMLLTSHCVILNTHWVPGAFNGHRVCYRLHNVLCHLLHTEYAADCTLRVKLIAHWICYGFTPDVLVTTHCVWYWLHTECATDCTLSMLLIAHGLC